MRNLNGSWGGAFYGCVPHIGQSLFNRFVSIVKARTGTVLELAIGGKLDGLAAPALEAQINFHELLEIHDTLTDARS